MIFLDFINNRGKSQKIAENCGKSKKIAENCGKLLTHHLLTHLFSSTECLLGAVKHHPLAATRHAARRCAVGRRKRRAPEGAWDRDLELREVDRLRCGSHRSNCDGHGSRTTD